MGKIVILSIDESEDQVLERIKSVLKHLPISLYVEMSRTAF